MSQSQGDIQERIAAARREAEILKEKIRASREASADTSCMYSTPRAVLRLRDLPQCHSARYGC